MAHRDDANRLDVRLVELGLAENRSRARALIMAGCVLVDDRPVTKAGTAVAAEAAIRLKGGEPLKYVSRGGLKLETALRHFIPAGLAVEQRVAIDVGASTGGFTDCLLQHGAARVFAVDVGYGQLAWKLRQDPRVVVLERTNIRNLSAPTLLAACQDDDATLPDLAVADVSFISLEKILEPTLALLLRPADLVVLIKPQFEVGKGNVGHGGVVRDAALREQAIEQVLTSATRLGLEVAAHVDSETPGAKKGNIEHLAWLRARA